jgi:hypothetical protein
MTQHPSANPTVAASVVLNLAAIKTAANTLDGLSTRAATHVADRELRPLLHTRPFPDADLRHIASGVDAAGDRVEKLIDRHLNRLAEFCQVAARSASTLDEATATTFGLDQ